jgi:hypothetical protein
MNHILKQLKGFLGSPGDYRYKRRNEALIAEEKLFISTDVAENLQISTWFCDSYKLISPSLVPKTRQQFSPSRMSAFDPKRTLRVRFANKCVRALRGLVPPFPVSNKEGAFVHFFLTFHTLP